MKKLFFPILVLLVTLNVTAQNVAINTTGNAAEAFKIINSGVGVGITAQSTGGYALQAMTQGNGNAILASTDKGFGVMSIINDSGIAVYGTSQRGNAAKFDISYSENTSPAV